MLKKPLRTIGLPKKPQFKISHYDDYHEIEAPKGWKAIELGCFYPKEGYNYCRYFALYYKGKKPSLDKVMQSLSRKVDFGETSECDDPVLGRECVEYDAKESMKRR